MAVPTRARPRLSLHKLALPVEHGGWGFLAEPILLGLLVAFSPAAIWLALAALAGFLARHPLMLALGDLRRRHTLPRTAPALCVAGAYAAVAIAGLAEFARLAPAAAWLPLAAAVAPASLFLYEDASHHVRSRAREMAGALAMGSLAAAIALSAGWSLAAALTLWILLAAKSVPTILHVRMQVRRLHGRPPAPAAARWASMAGLVLAAALAAAGLAPATAALALALVAAYGLWGEAKPPASARRLGWEEMGLGLATVLLIAAGYLF